MPASLNVSVGTEITFTTNGRRLFRTVEKVTPSGRFVAGSYTFNADGSTRGGGYSAPYSCRLSTPEDHAEVAAKAEWNATRNATLDALDKAGSKVRHAREYAIPEAAALLDALRAFETAIKDRHLAEEIARQAKRAA